jgi:hypothetical protein
MRRLLFPALLALTALVVPGNAAADDPPAARVSIEDRGPNRLLLATGIATLGFSYSVSAWVGATSPRESERFLLVPTLGPFIALAEREECGPRGPSVPCDTQSMYEGLLVASGALQITGVALIGYAFVKRERREVERPIVMPVALRGGAGLGAIARF